ncbi:MAG: hypothetical protein ACXW2I_00600 [Burkholderiales bacterium]
MRSPGALATRWKRNVTRLRPPDVSTNAAGHRGIAGRVGYCPHLHEACTWHMFPATCPVAQRADSPGAQVTAHEPQGPTAGALQDAPLSTFCFASFSFFFRGDSCAEAGFASTNAATTATTHDLTIRSSA